MVTISANGRPEQPWKEIDLSPSDIRIGVAGDPWATVLKGAPAAGSATPRAAPCPDVLSKTAQRGPRAHRVLVPLLLIVGAVLAGSSLRHDSITYDETSHLTSGMSYLLTRDFRLSPDHPPLARVWCALPLLLTRQEWPPTDAVGWKFAHYWLLGREWLFDRNDGERLVRISRWMMVILHAVTCLVTYWTARRLLGHGPALLTLTLAVLSTTMLAHGRLITTDMPVTLMFLLTLLAVGWLLEGITTVRVLAAGLAMGALSITKFSWPLILPALGIIAVYVALRPEQLLVSKRILRRRGTEPENAAEGDPQPTDSLTRREPAGGSETAYVTLEDRFSRVLVLAGVGVALLLVTWAVIWTCFLWRFSSVPAASRTFELSLIQTGIWDKMLYDASGGGTSLTVWFLEFADNYKLLPQGYLHGLAYTLGSTQERPSYLMGEYSNTGWRSYFPIAFALKTEIPLLVLLGLGIAALGLRRIRPRHPLLLWMLISFAAVYCLSAITTHLNIGYRHLLPLYPLILIVAGGSLALVPRRAWVAVPVMMTAWLLIENASIYPQYLCYFNQFVGGPSRGHEYLADSNLDWGQDLKRLAAWVRTHPQEQPIKLAYCGSANPAHYGFACEMLPSTYTFAGPAELTSGTYVISLNQLLGLYTPEIRDSFWADPSKQLENPTTQESALVSMLGLPKLELLNDPTPRPLFLAQCRLINRLRRRAPDERIGWSLFVYHLDAQEIAELLRTQ